MSATGPIDSKADVPSNEASARSYLVAPIFCAGDSLACLARAPFALNEFAS